MAEQIKMTIEIGGVEKAYKNMGELLKIIKETQRVLDTGTFTNKEQFTQLNDDLSKARQLYRSLKKEGTDLRPPEALEDFAQFGSVVSSSFALATSSIALRDGSVSHRAASKTKSSQLFAPA